MPEAETVSVYPIGDHNDHNLIIMHMVCSTLEENQEDNPDDSVITQMRLNISVGDPSKIRPYSSFTGLLLSLFSLTAFSFRKPKNKRKAE